MPRIEQYTRQIAPTQTNNVRAGAESFGGDTTGQQMQARALQQMGQAMQGAGDVVADVVQKRNNRIDTVNRLRDSERFYQEAFEEYNRASTEDDLTDPSVAEKFSQKIREKASTFIQSHAGSEESRIRLESEILNVQGQFTRQMQQSAIGAQRKFVMSKAGDRIKELAVKARQNPSMLGDIFTEADSIIQDLSPALYAEDEIGLVDAAQSAITLSALQSYTDAGQYDEAKSFIDQNPFVLNSLGEAQQRAIMTEITGGIAARNKEINETRTKINVLKTAAQELGVDVSGAQIFSAVTGVENAQTPAAKIDEFAALTGKSANELTPSVIAKIAYGVDLPSADQVDFNKEFTPKGDYTPKGIQAKVKEPFDKAAAAKVFQDKVSGAIQLFRQNGNKQALLSAMITFQKALDEGAVVREGDIVLQQTASSISDRISTFVKPGQVIGDEMVDEMEATMLDFTSRALQSAKAQIDPLLTEGDKLGYRRTMTIPQEAYNSVFAGVKDDVSKMQKEGAEPKKTMTLDEFLQQ